MIFTPIKETYGNLITIEQFLDNVDCGGFIDYDGFGYLSYENKESDIKICPSNCYLVLDLYANFTHINWYNK